MQTSIRKIGNSRGVLIPTAFLASCHIEDQVDMQLQDGQIIIKPIRRKLRDKWFTPVAQTSQATVAQEQTESQDWGDAPLTDDSEWVW